MKPQVTELVMKHKATRRPECCRCLRVPGVYAILPHCHHAYCIPCLTHSWRCLTPHTRYPASLPPCLLHTLPHPLLALPHASHQVPCLTATMPTAYPASHTPGAASRLTPGPSKAEQQVLLTIIFASQNAIAVKACSQKF
ncbi:uncharacterized protein LOC108668585 [Hyalella azteca]|uniref:Uncharacterized protein LOC108668585 n=1 Tax=Hyalella azteca TaxID=294128 RepID=A0A8B7NCK1_HYAAZ|nr:uncharacterized protein LOC108668585 [Hyalella azteca]